MHLKPSYAFQLPEDLVRMQILNQEFWGEAQGSEEALGCAVAAGPGTTLPVAGLHVTCLCLRFLSWASQDSGSCLESTRAAE